ncbi:heme biosynthesis HemY N-terminal domain-containing protein [Salinisphaera aquimarina]|uniref:Heme biosynthesis HemY N-terminal domain-containing protein n=1 Tax=Salinisphaera aquimarina TaxID=2094031 RepID=A0ABV7EWI8_9GAMM
MRRLLLIFFVFIILGVVLALVFRDQHGYMLISFAGWQVETSLLFAAGALLVTLWLVITLWRLIVAGVLLPRTVREKLARRRARKARRSLYDGLLKLSEGRWSKAEQELNRMAEKNEAPGLNYLNAARAAQHQGHVADRDRYLEKAAARRDVSELAVLLTQAQLQIEQGQAAEASASLARLYQMEPHHPLVLRLYAEQALRAGDYEQLRGLAPALYKHSTMSPEQIDRMAIEAWSDELARQKRDVIALTTAWKRVPKRLRAKPEMIRRYVDCLHAAKADDQAADVIRGALKQEWNASLVLTFGDLKCEDRTAQLSTVEAWLKQYGEEPELLLIAGRLCLRNRLWGRARSYFEASQKNQSRPDALLELGRLFEEINEKDEARAAYRQGLELRVDA